MNNKLRVERTWLQSCVQYYMTVRIPENEWQTVCTWTLRMRVLDVGAVSIVTVDRIHHPHVFYIQCRCCVYWLGMIIREPSSIHNTALQYVCGVFRASSLTLSVRLECAGRPVRMFEPRTNTIGASKCVVYLLCLKEINTSPTNNPWKLCTKQVC